MFLFIFGGMKILIFTFDVIAHNGRRIRYEEGERLESE